MARWSVAVSAHVVMRVVVEADSMAEANRKAVEVAKKRKTPRPHEWRANSSCNLDRKNPLK